MDKINFSDFFSDKFRRSVAFNFYKSRHILTYIAIGVLAISAELVLRELLLTEGFHDLIATSLSFVAGIAIAFFLNVKFNFHISRKSLRRALFYFWLISIVSISIQELFKRYFLSVDLSYEALRFIISGAFFLLSYFLHRKISFKDTRQVGVAVYADGMENIAKIFQSIGQYPDFVHVDIVDETYNPNAIDARAHRIEVARAYWPNMEIQTHIMSKTPSVWLKDAIQFSNAIYMHDDIEENFVELCNEIKGQGVRAGLALHAANSYENLAEITSQCSDVLILTIPKPGFSGQKFMPNAVDLISQINNLPNRSNFKLCVDGGITNQTIKLVEAELIVSGSYVLNAPDPRRQIMRLQTLFGYERGS